MARTNLKFFIISSIASIVVSLEVICKNDAKHQEPLNCTCQHATDIEWLKNGQVLSQCSSGTCIPGSVTPLYRFGSESTNQHTITINSFDENLCGNYSCRIFSTTDSTPFPECATCTCDNKDAICDCKTGMIVFTAINYVLDIVYFGIMVVLTLGIRALAKCAPQGNLKSVVIGCATSATIFLDIGLTINLFLNVESAEECCCTNGSKCGHGLRVGLAVGGWLLSCFGFALLIRHIAKGGCGGRGGSAETDHCNQAPESENLRSGDSANTAI